MIPDVITHTVLYTFFLMYCHYSSVFTCIHLWKWIYELPFGNSTYLWEITIGIVNFPMKNGGSFQFVMLNYQRVWMVFFHFFQLKDHHTTLDIYEPYHPRLAAGWNQQPGIADAERNTKQHKTRVEALTKNGLPYLAIILIMKLDASICFNMLQYASICFNMLQYASKCFNVLQYASICFNMLQYASICFNMLQYASK